MRFPLDLEAYLTNDDQNVVQRISPTETQIPFGGHCGAFGAARRHDVHTGIDLYAPDGAPVYAITSGIVVGCIPFTGAVAGCPWWLDTMAVLIEDDDGIWLYGEVEPNQRLKPGMLVIEGECIGSVKRVLRHDKGRPVSMLHVERYVSGTRQFAPVWNIGEPQPPTLLDPTEILSDFDKVELWRKWEGELAVG